jgi:hypothetical protein
MKFALTFNKPAVANFIDMSVHEGMKVKIEGDQVFFKPTKAARGNGVFALAERTRGGIGIEISGRFADEFLKKTGLERGSHMKLHATSYGWMVAEPMEAPGVKPSKIVPCARLWRATEEVGTKAEKAPIANVARASRGRGRPPKAAAPTEQPKKRGRRSKAEIAAEQAAAEAAPKRRGRRPKAETASAAASA